MSLSALTSASSKLVWRFAASVLAVLGALQVHFWLCDPVPTILPEVSVKHATASDDAARLQSNLDLIRPRPRDLSLIFMGDSLTRYQYLSLAFWLRHGRWWSTDGSLPDLMNSHSYHHPLHPDEDWNEFFWQSNRLLWPNEACDCRRRALVVEERRYYRDDERNNTLVYINLNGNETTEPGRGFYGRFPNSFLPNFDRYRGMMHTEVVHVAWEFADWPAVVRGHVGRLGLGGSTVVLNAGLHEHDFDNATARHALVEALEATNLHGMWKTTTPKRNESRVLSSTDQAFCRDMACLNLTWLANIDRRWYFDDYHYIEPVYRLMNEQLLAQLGRLPLNYDRLDPQAVLE